MRAVIAFVFVNSSACATARLPKSWCLFNIMAPGGGSKLRLDTPTRPRKASPVRSFGATATLALALLAAPLHAQAPPAADLWRVTTTTLSRPPAFEMGTTGAFWNPAPTPDPTGFSLGLEMARTSEVVGLSGLLAGAGYSLGPRMQLGLLYGRMQVRGLVRTTTSPASVEGTIPVYEQMVGANVGARFGFLQAGLLLAYQDAQFDFLDQHGFTLDAGIRIAAHKRLNLAAATHFFPIDFTRQETTDYYLGAEFVAGDSVPFVGAATRVVFRYGATYGGSGYWDHTLATGLTMDRTVRVEFAVTSEAGYIERAVRFGLGVGLLIGRYEIGLSAGSGSNDLGATFRVGIDAQILQ